jgi:hypothetical protein
MMRDKKISSSMRDKKISSSLLNHIFRHVHHLQSPPKNHRSNRPDPARIFLLTPDPPKPLFPLQKRHSKRAPPRSQTPRPASPPTQSARAWGRWSTARRPRRGRRLRRAPGRWGAAGRLQSFNKRCAEGQREHFGIRYMGVYQVEKGPNIDFLCAWCSIF